MRRETRPDWAIRPCFRCGDATDHIDQVKNPCCKKCGCRCCHADIDDLDDRRESHGHPDPFWGMESEFSYERSEGALGW